MTATVEEMGYHDEEAHVDQRTAAGTRRRWLIPALAVVGIVAAALLVTGLVAPSLLLYAGILAGCGLMHLFGHGAHGGHGSTASR